MQILHVERKGAVAENGSLHNVCTSICLADDSLFLISLPAKFFHDSSFWNGGKKFWFPDGFFYFGSQNWGSMQYNLKVGRNMQLQRLSLLPRLVHWPIKQGQELHITSHFRRRSAHSNGKSWGRSMASMLIGLMICPLCIALSSKVKAWIWVL